MKHRIHILTLWALPLGAFAAPQPAFTQRRLPTPRSPQFASKWDGQSFSHRLFDSLLRRHVKLGRVDYAGIRRYSMALMREYQHRLANTNPARLKGGKAFRLAFWINAHNALSLLTVLRRGLRTAKARKRVKATARRPTRYAFQVGGRWYTPAQIRNQIIRGRFKDPRALFALVGSPGDPWLRARAYTGRKLARRLRAAARRYLSHPKRGVSLDRKKKVVLLPQLFSRYRKDFSGSRFKGALAFVAAHLKNVQDAAFIQANLHRLTVRYRPDPTP